MVEFGTPFLMRKKSNELPTVFVFLLGCYVAGGQGYVEGEMNAISFGLGVIAGAGAMGATVIYIYLMGVFKGWE